MKNYFSSESCPTHEGLKRYLTSHLSIDGQKIYAEKIIEFLARNGDIDISNTSVSAGRKIVMGSNFQTHFSFGDNSESKTPKTGIVAGKGAYVKGSGGAKIVQDEDGNIKFYT